MKNQEWVVWGFLPAACKPGYLVNKLAQGTITACKSELSMRERDKLSIANPASHWVTWMCPAGEGNTYPKADLPLEFIGWLCENGYYNEKQGA